MGLGIRMKGTSALSVIFYFLCKKKILEVSFKLIIFHAVNSAWWVYECLLDYSLCFSAVSQFSKEMALGGLF